MWDSNKTHTIFAYYICKNQSTWRREVAFEANAQYKPTSLTVCLESKKNGNDLIYKSNYVFGIKKNKKGIDLLNLMEFHSSYFKILSF